MLNKRKKYILITGIVLAVVLLFCITILPFIIRSKAISGIAEATGRTTRIESVSVNPFTLTVGVKGLAIEDKNGGPFVSIGQFRASLSLASIFKRALIMDEVTIDKPSFTFIRTAPNRYNFSDILDRQAEKPKKESKGEFLFSINNINISSGSLDFDDQALREPRKQSIRDLKISLPFISNIPYLLEKYTDPIISAKINGADFNFSGKIKPLSKSMETSVRIELKQLDLPQYAAYSPVKPPVDLAAGKLSLDTELTYRVSREKKPELGIKGLVELDQVAINLHNGQPLLKLPSLQIKASDLEIFTQRFLFDAITVEGLELFASRNAKGEWMFSKLLAPTAEGGKKAPETKTQKPQPGDKSAQPLVRVAAFAINNAIVHINDALPKGGFKGEASAINLAVRNFSTEPGKSAGYELSLSPDKGTEFSAEGNFSLSPLSASASTDLTGLKIQRFYPYLSDFLASPVRATIDSSSSITFSRENGLMVQDLSIAAVDLVARYGSNEGLKLSRLEINKASYDQGKNRAEIGDILLSRGNISVSRESDGSISLLSLLKKQPAPAGKSRESIPEARQKKASGKTASPGPGQLAWKLGKLKIERTSASFTDKKQPGKPRFTLSNTALNLANLKGPKFSPASLGFSATFNRATPLKVRGQITPDPFHFKGDVSIGRLPLRDFEAYFPDNINVFLLAGLFDTNMGVDIALKDGKPIGSFSGKAGIRSFHAIDTVSEEDLLKWESLQLDDIRGSLEPFTLSLRQIALNGVYSRIIIRKDGSLNLQNLVTEKNGAGPAPEPSKQVAGKSLQPAKELQQKAQLPLPPRQEVKAAVQPSPAPGKQIKVESVTIQDGTLSFTDNHLPEVFSTTFYNLGGRISGLSSEESKLAEVDLRGNLENHSPLQITGRINPLRDDLFVDLKVAFRDIELSPVTPYSGTYLGYSVEKGKLFLDLAYHIEKKQLNSENKVFIDQFTFGRKVESDKATSLPVKLGLALLKDRKGEIHLDVPVTGRTDDPKFSIWKLVFQVFKNLMVKAVTSPMSLLSSMFGGDGDFSAITFAPGTSVISPSEEQKLAALSKALQDRPALKLELKGYVDRQRDIEGYRQELLDRKLMNEKNIALARERSEKDDGKQEPAKITPEEYPRLLAAVYKKEKFPKPRNVLGLVKDLPPDEMKKLIITNTVIGDTELQALARERVVSVVNYLVKKGNIPAERIFQKNDDLFKAPAKETTSRSRVELNAIAQ